MIRSVGGVPPVTIRPGFETGEGPDFRTFFEAAFEGQRRLAEVEDLVAAKDGLLGLQVEVFRATQQIELSARLVQSSVETTRKLLETPV
ncbi:MAG: hypothetical protein AAGD10_00870 [Myxococcota bacterium]